MLVYGGDRATVVPAELAAAFAAGDRLVVVQDTGDLLHIPRAEHELVSRRGGTRRSTRSPRWPSAPTSRSPSSSSGSPARSTTTPCSPPCCEANAPTSTRRRPRAARPRAWCCRRRCAPTWSAGCAAGRASPTRREQLLSTIDHEEWSVSSWRAPLGVVGFVFEGRPNVFADATGVLRTGNTAVFRIGSDALGPRRRSCAAASHRRWLQPACRPGAVQLVDSAAHAAGWALFADRRLGLAVARGSGAAVAQLGAVARQHGVPVSLHGTGERGSWRRSTPTPTVLADDGRALARPQGVQHAERVLHPAIAIAPNLRGDRRRAAATCGRTTRHRGGDARASTGDRDRRASATNGSGRTRPSIWLVEVESIAEAVELFNRYSPRFAASLISDDTDEQDGSTRPSTRRSSATGSHAGSTASSRSTNPSSACRTGRPAGCSPAAACCRATRSSPCDCEPRCATTPCIVDGRSPARASTDGWLAAGRLPGQHCLAACATAPGVVSTEARDRHHGRTESTAPPVDVSTTPRRRRSDTTPTDTRRRRSTTSRHRRPTTTESATSCSRRSATPASTSSTTPRSSTTTRRANTMTRHRAPRHRDDRGSRRVHARLRRARSSRR